MCAERGISSTMARANRPPIFARYEWLFAYDPVHADLEEAVC